MHDFPKIMAMFHGKLPGEKDDRRIMPLYDVRRPSAKSWSIEKP